MPTIKSEWNRLNVMKAVIIGILSIDGILLLLWIGGSIYLLSNKGGLDPCFHEEFVSHFLILIHFALPICIAGILDSILLVENEEHTKEYIDNLPYQFYSPVAWSITGVISLFGDIFLLTSGIVDHIHFGSSDQCITARKLHITFDSVATLTSLFSVLWFIVFSFYYLVNPIKIRIGTKNVQFLKK